MIEIIPNLNVGSQRDYESCVKHHLGEESQPSWRVIHACKEPYHRQALAYTGRAVSKDHPEYLIARRGPRLILNLVDVDNPAYIRKEIIDAALRFIHEGLTAGHRVLVHCNQGESRSPSIGLLYLAVHTDRLPVSNFLEAEAAFRKLYPAYNPKAGIRGFLIANWSAYISSRKA